MRRRSHSDCSSKTCERMSRNSERDAEQDQVEELVVAGHGHVRDQDHPDDEDGAERSVMPEHGVRREHRGRPHEQPEDQDVVQVLGRRRQVADGDVDVRLDGRVGGRVVEGPDRRAIGRGDQPGDERHEQRREDGADEERQPATPADLRADEPDQHAADGGEDEQVEVVGVAQHPPGVVDRPGHRQADEGHAGERQPALGRCEREAAPHRARISPSGRPGVTT